MLRLLSIFAQHLSILSNQLVVRRQKDGSPRIWPEALDNLSREPSSGSRWSLGDESPTWLTSAGITFCKMFKKSDRDKFLLTTSQESEWRNPKDAFCSIPTRELAKLPFACGFSIHHETSIAPVLSKIVRRSPHAISRVASKVATLSNKPGHLEAARNGVGLSTWFKLQKG